MFIETRNSSKYKDLIEVIRDDYDFIVNYLQPIICDYFKYQEGIEVFIGFIYLDIFDTNNLVFKCNYYTSKDDKPYTIEIVVSINEYQLFWINKLKEKVINIEELEEIKR